MSLTVHTTAGDLKIELFCESTPRTCHNFLALCASDYYKNCIFFRNFPGFITQTGDPTNTGKHGESIFGSAFPDEIRTLLKHDRRGILSMANSGPDTNQSQWFVTYGKHVHLDGKYTVFGRVIDGWDTLDALEKVEADAKGRVKAENAVKILNITIHANPIADQAD